MGEYLEVPVIAAKEIAEKYQKQAVVILAYDEMAALTHTTTYGVSAYFKENAAAVGWICSEAIGCDLSRRHDYEDFHTDYQPALFKESVEILQQIARRQGCTPHQLQRIERLLKACGHGLRQG
jgi:hypothetical protein